MLSSISKHVFNGKNVVRAASAMVGRRFVSDANAVEYEIIENMKTRPLFTEKVNVGLIFNFYE